MKFKFCGNIDCPEWLISEITLLTKISTIKLRIISNNLVNCILSNGKNLPDLKKALLEMKLNQEDSTIVISVLEFIFKNSAKFDTEDIILNQELQQLGLPQENADSVSKVYKTHKENLKNKLRDQIFTFSKIKDVEYKIAYVLSDSFTDFRVDESRVGTSTSTSTNMEEQENRVGNIKSIGSKVDLILNVEGGLSNIMGDKAASSHDLDNSNSNSSNQFHISTDKITLEKMIKDLEKSLELIKKYKNS